MIPKNRTLCRVPGWSFLLEKSDDKRHKLIAETKVRPDVQKFGMNMIGKLVTKRSYIACTDY